MPELIYIMGLTGFIFILESFSLFYADPIWCALLFIHIQHKSCELVRNSHFTCPQFVVSLTKRRLCKVFFHSGLIEKCSFIRAYLQNVPSFGHTHKIFLHSGVIAKYSFIWEYLQNVSSFGHM